MRVKSELAEVPAQNSTLLTALPEPIRSKTYVLHKLGSKIRGLSEQGGEGKEASKPKCFNLHSPSRTRFRLRYDAIHATLVHEIDRGGRGDLSMDLFKLFNADKLHLNAAASPRLFNRSTVCAARPAQARGRS